MGRPRKFKKRTKSGQIKKSEMDHPNLVKPTPEMLRHKELSGGGDINDPLSYLTLTDQQKQALSQFYGLAKAAGFGSKLKISSLNQRIGGTSTTSSPDDQRDARKRAEYEAAREALATSGRMHTAIVDMMRDYQGRFRLNQSSLKALQDGANALAKHFRITN